jgi:hypothetical protein
MPRIKSKLELSVEKKQNLITDAVQDNLATFDINGNVKDSGKSFGNDGTSNTIPLSNEMQAYVIQQLLNTPDLKSVNVASTANLSLSSLAAIDGFTPVANNLVLAKNQTNTSQNGVYFAKSTGWVRAVFNKNTESFQELTTETTYSELNINGGVVNVLNGTVGRNLQFQFSIQTPSATFGNSPVYVGATTKIPPRDVFNGFVSNNVGNDTNNNGSPAFPYATISKDLISASYPHCTTIASNGGSISESITFLSGNSNLTLQSSDTTTDAGKTSLTGQMTFATGNTRVTFKNTTHSTGANIPFVLQAGNQNRHKFENLLITTTNTSLFDIDAGVLNWMNLRNLDCGNSPQASIPLPNFTNPFIINIFNQTRRLPFTLKAGATGLNCTINLFNCPDFNVRIPSGFAGTVNRFDVRKVNEVILNQTRLDEILANTTLTGYYLISGFTPTIIINDIAYPNFKKGCVFGKQSAGGFTENWLEREFNNEQASIYDFNTKKTYIQDNDDWVQYQTGSGATIDDTTLSTSKVYSSQKVDNTYIKKTTIKSSFSATPLDTNLASEKLTKDNLDLKSGLEDNNTFIGKNTFNSPIQKGTTTVTNKTSNYTLTNQELTENGSIVFEQITANINITIPTPSGLSNEFSVVFLNQGTAILTLNFNNTTNITLYSGGEITINFDTNGTAYIPQLFFNNLNSVLSTTGNLNNLIALASSGCKIEINGTYVENITITDKINLSIEGVSNVIRSENGTTLLSTISGTVTIDSSSAASPVSRNIYLRNLIITGVFNLNKFASNSSFIFENCTFNSTVALNGNSSLLLTNIKFKDCYFTGNLTFGNLLRSNLLFEGCNFTTISITNNSTNSVITLTNCLNVPSTLHNNGENSLILIGNNTIQSTNGIVSHLNWNRGNSYKQNDVVNYQGGLYQAKSNIVRNTAWSLSDWVLITEDISDWTSFTPEIKSAGSIFNPTVTAGTQITAFFKKVGKVLHLNIYYYNPTGGRFLTGGNGIYYIPLPSGYTITSKISFGGAQVILGVATIAENNVWSTSAFVVPYENGIAINIFSYVNAGINVYGGGGAWARGFFELANWVRIKAEIPIN